MAKEAVPKVVARVETDGTHRVTTEILNTAEIGKALGRPASAIEKFFGKELKVEPRSNWRSGTTVLDGAHDEPKLDSLLSQFIGMFVKCPKCGNLETEMMIRGRSSSSSNFDVLQLWCGACGVVSEVKGSSDRHPAYCDILYHLGRTPSKAPERNKTSETNTNHNACYNNDYACYDACMGCCLCCTLICCCIAPFL